MRISTRRILALIWIAALSTQVARASESAKSSKNKAHRPQPVLVTEEEGVRLGKFGLRGDLEFLGS